MKTINSIQDYRQLTSSAESFLLFAKTDDCSVCKGLLPQIEHIESNFEIPFYLANKAFLPELAGELLLFTAPTVLIFHEGKEIHRFARFVRMDKLRTRLYELEEGLDV